MDFLHPSYTKTLKKETLCLKIFHIIHQASYFLNLKFSEQESNLDMFHSITINRLQK